LAAARCFNVPGTGLATGYRNITINQKSDLHQKRYETANKKALESIVAILPADELGDQFADWV